MNNRISEEQLQFLQKKLNNLKEKSKQYTDGMNESQAEELSLEHSKIKQKFQAARKAYDDYLKETLNNKKDIDSDGSEVKMKSPMSPTGQSMSLADELAQVSIADELAQVLSTGTENQQQKAEGEEAEEERSRQEEVERKKRQEEEEIRLKEEAERRLKEEEERRKAEETKRKAEETKRKAEEERRKAEETSNNEVRNFKILYLFQYEDETFTNPLSKMLKIIKNTIKGKNNKDKQIHNMNDVTRHTKSYKNTRTKKVVNQIDQTKALDFPAEQNDLENLKRFVTAYKLKYKNTFFKNHDNSHMLDMIDNQSSILTMQIVREHAKNNKGSRTKKVLDELEKLKEKVPALNNPK